MGVKPLAADDPILLHFILESYLQKLLKYNLEPYLIPSLFPTDLVDTAYEQAAGVLLLGGADFHPSLYGEELHPKTKPLDMRRDELDLRIARKAFADRKPILGICRGNQAIAIASGGSLHQHIPESFPDEEHGLSEGTASYSALAEGKSSHPVIVEQGSKIHAIIGKEQISVTTAHHQAVKALGSDFRISGRSPSGVVEIIEYIDPDYFCFGIQSHPEAEEKGDLEQLFDAFKAAVEEYH